MSSVEILDASTSKELKEKIEKRINELQYIYDIIKIDIQDCNAMIIFESKKKGNNEA